MSHHRQTLLLVVLLSALLVFTTAWSYGRLSDSRANAAIAAQELSECRALAEGIKQLSHKPTLAAENEIATGQLAQRIESAARSASLPVESIIRLSPEPARRVGRSPYEEKPTRLHLRSVQLSQLLPFMHALTDTQGGLRIKTIRLSAPREDAATELWNADLTLTYLIYAPQD